MSRARVSVLMLVVWVTALSATVTVPLEFRAVVRESTVIVVGHVTDVRGLARDDGGIDSIVTIAVDGSIKGDPDRYLSMRVPGGQIGRVRSTMIGAPTFDVRQQAVFFLKPGPDRMLRPVGVGAGVYRISMDAKTGAAMVDPPLVLGVTAAACRVVRGDPKRRLMNLKEFVSLTKLVMAGQTASTGGPIK